MCLPPRLPPSLPLPKGWFRNYHFPIPRRNRPQKQPAAATPPRRETSCLSFSPIPKKDSDPFTFCKIGAAVGGRLLLRGGIWIIPRRNLPPPRNEILPDTKMAVEKFSPSREAAAVDSPFPLMLRPPWTFLNIRLESLPQARTPFFQLHSGVYSYSATSFTLFPSISRVVLQ
jgi:hypothetical protein